MIMNLFIVVEENIKLTNFTLSHLTVILISHSPYAQRVVREGRDPE